MADRFILCLVLFVLARIMVVSSVLIIEALRRGSGWDIFYSVLLILMTVNMVVGVIQVVLRSAGPEDPE